MDNYDTATIVNNCLISSPTVTRKSGYERPKGLLNARKSGHERTKVLSTHENLDMNARKSGEPTKVWI